MKTGNDVRGAVGAEGACTRQKEKSRKWRVRSSGAEGARTRQKEKSKKWRVRSYPRHPGVPPKREPVHAKKKKAGNNVCGATPVIPEYPQKGNLHTPKRKKQ